MGLVIGLIKRIIKLLLYFTIFVAVILLIPNLPPYTKFTKIEIEPTLPRVGALLPNGALNNAQKLFAGMLIGPESLRIFNGELYTGLATGEIVKISPGHHVTFVNKIGKPCIGLSQEHICGRPLGFEIDEKNKLIYVADAYYGIWKFNLNTNKNHLLVSPNVEIDGKQVKTFNGIALGKNGELYWTHSSSDYDLKDGVMSCLSDPSGRLLNYNPAKNESKVLLDNLWFANGVAISPDNQFVLVAESNRYRIMKYYINGSKKGKSEVFIAGLPGVPDNLHVLPDGSGILITLYVAFDNENPLISQSLSGTPLARKFLGRLSRLIEIPFELLYEQYPHVVLEEIIYKIGHLSTISSMMPDMTGLIQLDWNGNIVSSYFNTDRSIGHASDVIVYNDMLLFGSPHSPYIASVPVPPLLKKAFSKTAAPSAKNEEVKITYQAKVESAQPGKVVKNAEKNKVKVVERKDIPSTAKPSVQKSPESNPVHINSPQVNKENQGPSKKDKFDTKPIKLETVVKPKSKEAKDAGTKQTINHETPSTKKNHNLKTTEETAHKVNPKTPPTKENINLKNTEETTHKVNPKTPPTKENINLKNTEETTHKVNSKTPSKENINLKNTEETTHKVNPKTPSKENINLKNTEETTHKVNSQNLVSKQKVIEKQDLGTKKTNGKLKVVTSESVEAPLVDKREPKIDTVKDTEKPKAHKKKESLGTKPSTAKFKVENPDRQKPDQIPVKEDILSDRVKPNEETLKVIKKNWAS